MKICSRCRRDLPYSSFYKERARKDGYQHHCKDCMRWYKASLKRRSDAIREQFRKAGFYETP